MPSKFEEEKIAAKMRYEEFLAALMSDARKKAMFEMIPSQERFSEMYESDYVTPLQIEFKSKNTGTTFKIENKFFPHSWEIIVPEGATKEEKSELWDIVLETIAHPKNAAEGYQPKMLVYFPENTPEDEIFEFIETVEAKGIEVNLFIGKQSEFDAIEQAHKRQTKESIASGKHQKLPGWDGYINRMQTSEGGANGREMMEKYHDENRTSYGLR